MTDRQKYRAAFFRAALFIGGKKWPTGVVSKWENGMEKEKIIGAVISEILMKIRCHLRFSFHKDRDGVKHVDCDVIFNSPNYQKQWFPEKHSGEKSKSFLTFEKK